MFCKNDFGIFLLDTLRKPNLYVKVMKSFVHIKNNNILPDTNKKMNCIFYRPLEEVIRIHEEKQVQFSQSLHFKQKTL